MTGLLEAHEDELATIEVVPGANGIFEAFGVQLATQPPIEDFDQARE